MNVFPNRLGWFSLACVLLFLAAGCFFAKETEILTERLAPAYRLTVVQVGDPDFPFGAVRCRIRLYDGNREIGREDLSLQNDGKNLVRENFEVVWGSDSVQVVAFAEEAEPIRCTLPFAQPESSDTTIRGYERGTIR